MIRIRMRVAVLVVMGLLVLGSFLTPVLLPLLSGAPAGAISTPWTPTPTWTRVPTATSSPTTAPALQMSLTARSLTGQEISQIDGGAAFQYIVAIANTTSVQATGALTDTLPVGVVPQSASIQGGNCAISAQIVGCNLTIAAHQQVLALIHVAVQAAQGTIIQNSASATTLQGRATATAPAVTVISNAPTATVVLTPTTLLPTTTVVASVSPTATLPPTATSTGLPGATATVLVATPSNPSASATATASATAVPGTLPDRCEPNNTLVQPCAIASELEVGNLTFVDGTLDVYSVLLKAERRYTILVRSTTGIDPLTTLYQAGHLDAPLAQNDDIAPGTLDSQISWQVETEGWYLITVANKAPGDQTGRTYAISVRSAALGAATPSPLAGGTALPSTTMQGDALENNYDVAHAALIGWDVPYDLNLICPDPAAGCPSGDHDFLLVPVKANIPFIGLTYDLGPGSDTFLSLYQPDPAAQQEGNGLLRGWRLIAQNDDVVPGLSLRSTVSVTPTWTGMALLVVAPSDRANPPQVPASLGPAGRYRLIVGSPELPALRQVLAAQTDVSPTPAPMTSVTPTATLMPSTTPVAPSAPTATVGSTSVAPAPHPTSVETVLPTASATAVHTTPVPPAPTFVPPTPTLRATATALPLGTPAPAPVSAVPPPVAPPVPVVENREVIRGSSLRGIAEVTVADTELYSAIPPTKKDLLKTYPVGAQIQLLGQQSEGWVKVAPVDSVMSGWMWAPNLRPLSATGTAPITDTATLTATGTVTAVAGSTSTAGVPSAAVPTPTRVATGPITIEPLSLDPLPTVAPLPPVARTLAVEVCTMARKGTACQTPLANMRVEIIQASTDQVVIQGMTNQAGQVNWSFSTAAGTKIRLRIPALGIDTDFGDNVTRIPVRIPVALGGV